MSLKDHPARSGEVAGSPSGDIGTPLPDPDNDPGYWYCLIDEQAAGDFLDLTARTMQKMRQRGDGCRFVKISSRCVKYRRADLKAWADSRLRSSTSDSGRADA